MEYHESESTEMYLETILVLKNRLGLVRSIDIANEMGYSKPTISVAMKKFRGEGLVTVDESGFVNLTEAGRDIAERIDERHQVLTHILMSLGVSREHAEHDASKIEHDICDETFDALKKEYLRLRSKKEPITGVLRGLRAAPLCFYKRRKQHAFYGLRTAASRSTGSAGRGVLRGTGFPGGIR